MLTPFPFQQRAQRPAPRLSLPPSSPRSRIPRTFCLSHHQGASDAEVTTPWSWEHLLRRGVFGVWSISGPGSVVPAQCWSGRPALQTAKLLVGPRIQATEKQGYACLTIPTPPVSLFASGEPSLEVALYKTWDLTSANSYCLWSWGTRRVYASTLATVPCVGCTPQSAPKVEAKKSTYACARTRTCHCIVFGFREWTVRIPFTEKPWKAGNSGLAFLMSKLQLEVFIFSKYSKAPLRKAKRAKYWITDLNWKNVKWSLIFTTALYFMA